MPRKRLVILVLTHALCLLCGAALAMLARPELLTRHRQLSSAEACAAVNANLKPVSRAIFKYINKYHRAPDDLSQLVAEGLLPALPRNPFYDRPAYNVRLDAQHRKGDYSYLTGNTEHWEAGKATVIVRDTFWLSGYGDDSSAAMEYNKHYRTQRLEQACGRSFNDMIFLVGTSDTYVNHGRRAVPIGTNYATLDELLRDYGYLP